MSTCDYPLPAAFPLPREDVLNHCYRKGERKCWWYENGICYADEPGNHRYPHVAGRARMRGILQDSLPEEQIDSDILRKCDEHGWRRAPWLIEKKDCCAACNAQCNGLQLSDECSIDTGVPLKVNAEAYEKEEYEDW